MHLIYIDDSGDEQSQIFSALAIPATRWTDVLQSFVNYRRELKVSDGINVRAEFHAWKFVSGRGRLGEHVVPRGRRCAIFLEMLSRVSMIPGARLFNALFPKGEDLRAMEWLLNRINRAMQDWDSHAMLLIDEGKDAVYTRLVRRLRVYNPIPSRYGGWREGSLVQATRNYPLNRLIEDPVFRQSEQSYFIQAVDFIAYSLLRRERPLASKTVYGLDQVFNVLSPILVREANTHDPDGIIRPRTEIATT